MVRDDLLLFRALFEKAAITTVVIQQVKPIGGDIHDTPTDYSDLADCVIQLSMAESDGELRRFVGINKHQGSNHAKELREFQIHSLGFHVDRKAVGLSGILTGQTQGSLRQLSEEVLPPLDELAHLLKSLTEGGESPDKIKDRPKEARSNLGFVDVLLREHFGVTEFQKIVAGEIQSPEDSFFHVYAPSSRQNHGSCILQNRVTVSCESPISYVLIEC